MFTRKLQNFGKGYINTYVSIYYQEHRAPTPIAVAPEVRGAGMFGSQIRLSFLLILNSPPPNGCP